MRPPPVTLADSSGAAADPGAPLSGAEVRALLVARWQANHDLRLVQIRGRLYLQVMWNHLEQQSFPLSVEDYADHIERVAAALNDLTGGNGAAVAGQHPRPAPPGKGPFLAPRTGVRPCQRILAVAQAATRGSGGRGTTLAHR